MPLFSYTVPASYYGKTSPTSNPGCLKILYEAVTSTLRIVHNSKEGLGVSHALQLGSSAVTGICYVGPEQGYDDSGRSIKLY